MPEVVLRDMATKDHPGDTGKVVVQARPEPCIDDLVAKVIRHFEIVYGIQVASWSGCIETMDLQVEALRAEKAAEHLGHRRRDRAMGSRIFRMVLRD